MSQVAMTLALRGDTIVHRKNSLLENEINDEIVALDVHTGICFGFNETASALWRRTATRKTVRELIDEMTAEYAVDQTQCMADVAGILQWLEHRQLVMFEPATP